MGRPPKAPSPADAALRPVSLKFIAQHLGLSVATISAVVNDSPAAKSISAATKARILEAAKQFNYRPNFMARSLRQRRSYTVALVVPEISEGYAATIMAGIEERLMQEGFLYFIASHHGNQVLLDGYPRMLLDRAVEGFILLNTPPTKEYPVPVVSISSRSEVRGITDIRIDNEQAARLALEHLYKLGHREIAFFKGHPGSADTEPRWQGIEHAARSLGLKVKPELTVQLKGTTGQPEPSTPEEGYFYARKLMEQSRRFTALFAFNDISAIGAISAFFDAGQRVPEDLSVVGFDDIKAAAFHHPRLTTVRQPLHHMGRLAATTLLERIANPEGVADHILVDPELVVRESTAPVRTPPHN